ncbi:histidine kinase [Kordia sp.]|uniref:sensor histidine kinase n=1 Tax=Kordia sp. TaxID=1965332 RepID=UPI0025C3CCCF|nr:histidine kinase [Kordia sp.]MCH2196456.1 histidine kinase [Kordia sp.]
MRTIKNKIFHKKTLFHLLFWILLLAYYIGARWPFDTNKMFLFENMFFSLLVQVGLTYLVLFILIPKLLNNKKRGLFVISIIIAAYLTYVIYNFIKSYYLIPKYPEVYLTRHQSTFLEQITDLFPFFHDFTALILPTAILTAFEYYRNQKEILTLKEQKKSSELEALKNQLNPHFLFNTLNNLYLLTLKKSDDAPEIIHKLSEILDYILFRCNDKFVPLTNEIKLLDNYIALEKIRYGKRLKINFEHDVETGAKIAPLLLLTFVENAFKHGVSEEINEARITITLKVDGSAIFFKIENTKPSIINTENETKNRQSLGLQNVKKQLDILYGNNHVLTLNDNEKNFSATLNLITN